MEVVVTPDAPKSIGVSPNYLWKLNYDFDSSFIERKCTGNRSQLTDISSSDSCPWSASNRAGIPMGTTV